MNNYSFSGYSGWESNMRTLENIWNEIVLAQNGKFKICIWGAGALGKTLGYDILKILNIKIDFYCDNNEKLWGKEIVNGILCVDYHQLSENRENIFCLICLKEMCVSSVIEQLMKMGISHYITSTEILKMPDMVYNFFPFMKKKTVAYTCVVGDYDNIREPGENVLEKYDFYLISDKKPQQNSIYKWIDINDLIPNKNLDYTRMNRYCKINAHKIFPGYKKSIYYDGNVILEHDLEHCFEQLKQTRIGVASPLYLDCLYEEAIRLLPLMRDDYQRIYSQVERYWNEGMPTKFGSCWCNVLIREHNNPVCIRLMEDWWNEVNTQSKRDQLSFPYILWKNGYSLDDIFMISDDSGNCNYWKYIYEHNIDRLVNMKDI